MCVFKVRHEPVLEKHITCGWCSLHATSQHQVASCDDRPLDTHPRSRPNTTLRTPPTPCAANIVHLQSCDHKGKVHQSHQHPLRQPETFSAQSYNCELREHGWFIWVSCESPCRDPRCRTRSNGVSDHCRCHAVESHPATQQCSVPSSAAAPLAYPGEHAINLWALIVVVSWMLIRCRLVYCRLVWLVRFRASSIIFGLLL